MERHQNTLQAVRNASQPYTLHLDAPYQLSTEKLNEQVEPALVRKRQWFFPKLKFVSLKNNLLTLHATATADKGITYEIRVKLEPDKLHVSCNCDNKAETLCFHAYKVLERFTWYGRSHFFAQFKPKGIMELAQKHPRYFQTSEDLTVTPKDHIGKVYAITEQGLNVERLLSLPIQTKAQKKEDTELAYLFIRSYRNKFLPALIPATGVLNKDRTNIKLFHQFLAGLKDYTQFMTDDQKVLNSLCFQLWKLVEKNPGSQINFLDDQQPAMIEAYNSWEKILPLLFREKFVYVYNLYGLKELKERPHKNRISALTLTEDKPQLHFHLKNQSDFYRLEIKVSVNGKTLRNFDGGMTFFVSAENKVFFLQSVRDAAVMAWLHKNGGQLTIFKEHYSDFKNTVLQHLSKHYHIAFN